MANKPTYKDLEQKIISLKEQSAEHRKIEEALQESEERFRSLFQTANAVILYLSPELRIKEFNPAAERFYGLKREDVLGKDGLELLIPEEERDAFAAVLKKVLTGKPTKDFENQIFAYDGNEHVFIWDFNPLYDARGNSKGIVGTGRDITEFKKAERALRESENLYRLLAENIDDVIWRSDLAFHWEYISPSTERLTGFTSKEAMKIPIEEKLTPASFEKAMHLLQETLDDLKTNPNQDLTKQLEFEYYCKDGSTVWAEVNVKMELDEEGNPKGLIGVTRNITDRKKAEEEKVRLESQLQQAQKMEVMGTLAGGVAHDLNNVLSGIVAYPDLLLMKLPRNSPLRKFILAIQDSAEKAAAIVQDLMTLTRRMIATYEPVDLNAVVSEYLRSPEYIKMKSFYSNIEVKTNFEKDLMNILGSPVHLSKTIMNLISNAAEAIIDKGKIFISTENRHISKAISGYENIEEGEYVALIVADTGAGMTLEDKKRVFEPFYTKKKMGRSGTGLGMAVVWGTVRDHKGCIDIQSAIGKGTTITLYFPMTRQRLSEDQVSLAIEDYMGAGESILVVDDIEIQRELAVAILSELNYSVTAVASGEEAVEYLKDHSVDLLLLDMIMDPDIDGFETYKRVLETHPMQKAIIVSGFSETDRVRETLRLGAGQYVMKPYTLEKIGIAVRDELGRS
jgi:PAS domain S-box-containing protein